MTHHTPNVITAAQARQTTTAANLLAVADWNDAHHAQEPTGGRVDRATSVRRRQQAQRLRLVAAELAVGVAGNDNSRVRVAA